MTSNEYRRPESRAQVDLFLDANEGLAPGPDVLSALALFGASQVRRYPDTAQLERTIAARFGTSADRILVTAGADDGIDRCCRVALSGGGTLLMPRPGFEMFERYGALAGGTVRPVAWTEGSLPVGEFIGAVNEATRAIAIISPNNPNGLVATATQVRELALRLPDVLIIVDAAYAEFASEDLTPLALEFENVVALRSFSKAWGLASARVGYAVGRPRWIRRLRASGPPYAVSGASIALASAALASGEQAMQKSVEQVGGERTRLTKQLARLGADPVPSEANFVLARFADAGRVREELQSLGIAVRGWENRPELANQLRISCPANERDFNRLTAALETALRPEAVLFDMDGVLVDEGPSYRQTILETARSFGVETSRAEVARLKSSGGWNNDWELTHRILGLAGVDASYESVVERFESIYQGTPSKPGLCEREEALVDPDFLQRLARRYPLAVVTGRPRRDAEAFLQRTGIRGCFGAVVTLDDAPAKPDPRPVRLALDQLGVQRAWMIGDTPDDAQAARAAGVLPIGILPPDTEDAVSADDLIASGCARVLTNLQELEEQLP